MIEIKTNAPQLRKSLAKRFERAKDAANRATLREALTIQGEIRIEWPVATGESRQQIAIQQVSTNGVIGYRVIANSEYAKYIDNIDPSVEFVRRPARVVGKEPIEWLPNLGAIEEWARRKGIKVGGENTDESDVIFAIAYRIAEQGIRNAKIFFTVLNRSGKRVTQNITAAIMAELT